MVTLLGLDGEVIDRRQMRAPLTPFLNRPVAEPLSLDQLRRMAAAQSEDDDLPPLVGDLDDERDRLPRITVETYKLEPGNIYRRVDADAEG